MQRRVQQAPGGDHGGGTPVERLWPARLRWRLRGAWQWPAFAVLTALDGLLLAELPFYAAGPGGVVPGVLLAGFANLFCVAVLAPLAGARLRRARPDLPRLIARDHAGTALMVLVGVAIAAGGLVHRPALARDRAEVAAAVAAAHDYVLAEEPEYRDGLAGIDAMRVDAHLYRACVPGPDPRRWLCVFVTTDRRPARIKPDPDRAPNAAYRMHGGFR
jgi:hypothetical protein